MDTLTRRIALAMLTLLANAAVQADSPAAKAPEPPTAAPLGFALIPAGEFVMGDALDGEQDALQHKVNVSAFYIHKTEVTTAQWDEVRQWAVKHGYTGLPEGNGKAADHPVQSVSWHSAVKWCNARSEKDGLEPCYYTDAAQTRIYREDETDLVTTAVKWNAAGYRLPTEAEWEKAARGRLDGKRFPWGDSISHTEANFWNEGNERYQNGSAGFHPDYRTNGIPFTSPVGSFAANDYGLYDMAGNVWEWCWDWGDWGENRAAGLETDPRGAALGLVRVLRDGGWGGPRRLIGDSLVRAVGGNGEPADGAREPAERIVPVARVAAHPGEAARMQRLHEQRAHAAHQCRQVGVHDPGCISRQEEAGTVARGHHVQPRRDAGGIAAE